MSSKGSIKLSETVVREGNTLRSVISLAEGPVTIPGLLARNAGRFADRPAYREKKEGAWREVSWSRFAAEVGRLQKVIRASGIGTGDRVAVLSRNRGEMLTAEFAVMGIGAIYVPLFAGYSAEQTRALLRHARPSALFLSDEDQCRKIEALDGITLIVTFDAVPRESLDAVFPGYRGAFLHMAGITAEPAGPDRRDQAPAGEQASAGADAMRPGGSAPSSETACGPETPCLLMYTSGTGGELKGVLLRHENILSQQRALSRIWSLGPEDRFLSYLPWHHSFGGIFEKYNALYNAAPIALDDSYGKDFPKLLENWRAVRPTVYFSVPAIYQQLVDHVRLHPEEEERIFPAGMKFVFTAAAPLPAGISGYFGARKIPVAEGWGLTETSPCCTVTDLGEPRTLPGMVGHPIPGVEVRVADDGEILVRGPNVMSLYWENPEATAQVLPGDGWFRTGDLGELVGTGLRLVARKDRIFKLLNGERVIPTPLETRLSGASRYIRHVIVTGTAREHLTALVFPNLPLIEAEFGEDRVTADRVVKESIVLAIRELNETHPIRYERIQAFAVVDRALSIENGDLTPSMKVRVSSVLGSCEEYIEAVYEPREDCDCRFLRKVIRLKPEPRFCFRGKEVTLDRCHECGLVVFPDAGEDPAVQG